jgi:hypothetical protein
MSHVPLSKSAEIDRNLTRFLEMLPELMPDHAGKYVLMRHGNVVAFFDLAIDAQIAGNKRFDDRIFSIQLVNEIPEELGYFSYAVDSRQS